MKRKWESNIRCVVYVLYMYIVHVLTHSCCTIEKWKVMLHKYCIDQSIDWMMMVILQLMLLCHEITLFFYFILFLLSFYLFGMFLSYFPTYPVFMYKFVTSLRFLLWNSILNKIEIHTHTLQTIQETIFEKPLHQWEENRIVYIHNVQRNKMMALLIDSKLMATQCESHFYFPNK